MIVSNALVLRAQRGDAKARNELWKFSERLVRYQCRSYSGIDIDDMMQNAAIGWLYALKRWRPNGGLKFMSYMSMWAKAFAGRSAYIGRRTVSRESSPSRKELTPYEPSDNGDFEDSFIEQLARRQVLSIVDGLKDRRLVMVLRERMAGSLLREVAQKYGPQLHCNGRNGREWVRQLERRALSMVSARVDSGSYRGG